MTNNNKIGIDSASLSRQNPYTSDALKKNPYLGWQPPLLIQQSSENSSVANFSWASCFANSPDLEFSGKAPDDDGSKQPFGCLEQPAQLGNDSFPVLNETSWVPDVSMLRTMLMYGKDIKGNPYPPLLSKDLCKDMNGKGEKNVTDENKICLREAKIKPMGPLSAVTVNISPWNHFGVDLVADEDKISIEVPAPKVLCMAYTVKNSHSTRIRAIRDTWAGGCDGFLAFSSSSDPRLPAIALQQEGPQSYDNMWQKVRSIWKFVGTHYLNDFDWFFLSGDDTFVLPNNLRTYLASLTYKDNKTDPRVHEYYVGRRFYYQHLSASVRTKHEFLRVKKLLFNTGGAGYALSHATLRKFLSVVEDSETCSANEKTSAEDVMMAICLSYLGIEATDTRDFEGRERFHHFLPGRLYNWDIKDKEAKNWYLHFNSLWGLKNGKDCCAPDTVSFHYAKQPAMARHLHALLHHCRDIDG